jgi:heterodisulfide reductase subunit C
VSGAVKRFNKAEMTTWPKWDANIILIFEIVLMLFLLNMNATDTVIYSDPEGFFFSNFFVSLYDGARIESVKLAGTFFWWAHIIGIFIFANYVPYSKHLHIFLAFPNSYYADLNPQGKMENMDAVTTEVQIMLGLKQPDPNPPTEIPRFGAKDVQDLSQKSILDALTCTECGRCTDNCPANITGKTLSPRAIMMATRDRAEDVITYQNKNGQDASDGKYLLGDYIKDEEINACTSCNACVEACPVSINPLSIITELRRYKIMEESQGPAEWNMMYQNIETSFSPWKFAPTDRFKWAESVNVEPNNDANNE